MNKKWFIIGAFLLIAVITVLITGNKNENTLQPNDLSSQVSVGKKHTYSPKKESQPEVSSLNQPAGPKSTEDKGDIKTEKTDPRDKEFAEKLGLVKEKDNPLLKILETYSKEELDLLARIQRQVSDIPMEPINKILEMNRQKKGADELLIKADELFNNNDSVRTIVRKWIRDIYGLESKPPEQPMPSVIDGTIKEKE